ncbi:TIGR00725 family protein [Nitratireductor sp. GZWM139]|uniref:TIGR00725 family protein n=1 Tax=Nitratireductor sp. GZWM139 TaxID=2950541 RepID=UPI0024BE78F1|nr:TIGR00725 family protein [Nitratireductor sp. GZWM139]MDJ1465849.1 TIGR00725 family protein [Nitratireductor sp. GZWM139]
MTQPIYRLADGTVYGINGRLDPWDWSWKPATAPEGAREATARQAIAQLAATAARRIPVGVIGPRECDAEKLALAEQVGAGIGALGLTMICGGRTGVMAAAAKGCRAAGGLTVGLLPGHDWREANDDIMLPIATGFSEARNMIIAKSCAVLVAVGGSYGTLSEIAYGLHFSKPVIVLGDAPDIEGTERANGADDAIERLSSHLIASAILS